MLFLKGLHISLRIASCYEIQQQFQFASQWPVQNNPMEFHGILSGFGTWNSMEFYGVPWNSMEFCLGLGHGVP